MSALSFRHRAIAYLRDQMEVHTYVLPQTPIEDERGNARFEASLIRARTSSTLNLASLYALTTAAIIALVGERPMSATAHDAYRYTAMALAVGAILLFAAALWSRRRAMSPLSVELRGGEIVDASAVEDVRGATDDRAVWILAAKGFTNEALAAAHRLHVRCFAAKGDAITECFPVQATAAAEAA
jgi:hypothetical protein